MRTICLPPTGVSQPIFPWICWCLWTSRNKLIFENKVLSVSEVLSLSITSAREWWLAQPTAMKAPRQPNLIIPTLNAEANCVSVFTDAAWRASDGATGCGWIFKDSTRQSTQHGSKCFDNTASALTGEALAIRLALSHALSLGYTRVCVFSDCQVLVRAICSKSSPVKLYGLVCDIELLSSLFDYCTLSFISRSLNLEADLLAKSALFNAALTT